jgi:pyrimidine-nucleoside phosphorylase
MTSPYRILQRKRLGARLDADEIRVVARGAAEGTWTDAQLAAFLMAAAIHELDLDEMRALTVAMLESGEQWDLAREIPTVGDKHSTGGVGDKISLILAPLLAACGLPTVMLTGRGLGHTGGTADKLESVPGLRLDLDRPGTLRLLREVGCAIGMATGSIAPADRRLYALRDHTATVESIPLIVASILSKKLASGAAGLVLDVKTGDGAFLADPAEAERLARQLVTTCRALGRPASALLTDMSQPLGCWVGNACEVEETLACLEGRGPADLLELTYALAEELGRLVGVTIDRQRMERAIGSGTAREAFDRWAAAQGADPGWLRRPELPLAPVVRPITAPRGGVVQAVATKQLGLLLAEAGGGRTTPGGAIDPGVSLFYGVRLGQRVAAGEELARLYLRRDDERLVRAFGACFTVGDEAVTPPPLVGARIV